MDSQDQKSKKVPEGEAKSCDLAKATKNTILFLLATAVVGAAVYLTIKEGQRIKKENELLDYEVW